MRTYKYLMDGRIHVLNKQNSTDIYLDEAFDPTYPNWFKTMSIEVRELERMGYHAQWPETSDLVKSFVNGINPLKIAAAMCSLEPREPVKEVKIDVETTKAPLATSNALMAFAKADEYVTATLSPVVQRRLALIDYERLQNIIDDSFRILPVEIKTDDV